jgi:hypothetical protein
MHHLFPSLHNPQWMVPMKTQSNSAIAKPSQPSISCGRAEGQGPGELEVNVVFTDQQATILALKTAESLARDLGACIRMRAAIAVPYPLPVDKPPVPVSFTRRLLSALICNLEQGAFEPTIDLYLCRDRRGALLKVLKPNSLVIIGGRKRWWATPERRMADALRSKGHQVVFVGIRKERQPDLR